MNDSERVSKSEAQSGAKHKKAPYDEQNTADYQEMSKRIASALELMEHDTEIPATEKELARLAICSRGTLRNRGYPLVRLRIVKQMRNANKTITTSPTDPSDAQKKVDDRKKLLDDLKASRTEAARWFSKYKESEADRERERRAREILVSEKNALLSRIEQIERKQDHLLNPKSEPVVDDSINRVVPFGRSA